MSMTTVVRPPHTRGRPRVYDDCDIFAAVGSVLARSGFTGVTVAAVAAEIGCTAPGLAKRFRTRQALLLAFLAWSTAQGRERFRRVREEHPSPLAALRARVALPVAERQDEVTAPSRYANLVTLVYAGAADPVIRPAIQRRRDAWMEETTALLADALAVGELRPCDPARLGRVLLAALTGAAQIAATCDPDVAMERLLGEMVDDVVAPYLPERP